MRVLHRSLARQLALLTLTLLSACASQPKYAVQVGARPALKFEGIGPCDGDTSRPLQLDPKRPLAVLVHGCNSSRRDFVTLAKIFALHDRQTVCYRYDDRERLRRSSARLRHDLVQLTAALEQPDVLVFGHSQGGLVARAALTDGDEADRLPSGRFQLVTVSSPFGGINAARHCGSVLYHIASLGITVGICRAISGAKWNEIHPSANMVVRPSTLAGEVTHHLTIVTDERDTCRRYSADGRRCEEDDFVFTLEEQRNPRIERDRRVIESPLVAGHVEVVGARGEEPRKLLRVLQTHGVLRQTRPDEELAVEQLTAHLGW